MVNGAGTPALLPPKPPKLLPGASRTTGGSPGRRAATSCCRLTEEARVPSRVCPYHSLFIACASAASRNQGSCWCHISRLDPASGRNGIPTDRRGSPYLAVHHVAGVDAALRAGPIAAPERNAA